MGRNAQHYSNQTIKNMIPCHSAPFSARGDPATLRGRQKVRISASAMMVRCTQDISGTDHPVHSR
jgi:predicted alpha/beta-hydrolase family hydrolase